MRIFSRITIVLVLILIIAMKSYANPMTDLELSYSYDDQILHVEVKHLVKNFNKEFIRKLVVVKNGEEVETKYYQRQGLRDKFVEDVSVMAVEGDKFAVEVFAKEGGSKSAEFTVPAQEQDQEQIQEEVMEDMETNDGK